MDAKATQTVRKDFLAWTGGFPPDSEMQIFVYMEYAHGADRPDADDVREMLRDWMNSGED
ncbi:MAG: hypothetical protein IT426_20405 [Pirellulales bacterium]|nr:hypothetical protein [Pirellulales bacterium]